MRSSRNVSQKNLDQFKIVFNRDVRNSRKKTIKYITEKMYLSPLCKWWYCTPNRIFEQSASKTFFLLLITESTSPVCARCKHVKKFRHISCRFFCSILCCSLILIAQTYKHTGIQRRWLSNVYSIKMCAHLTHSHFLFSFRKRYAVNKLGKTEWI